MSWYGMHPKIDRSEARNSLLGGACRRCVYWFSVFIGSDPSAWGPPRKCSRCGTDVRSELKKRFTKEHDDETA